MPKDVKACKHCWTIVDRRSLSMLNWLDVWNYPRIDVWVGVAVRRVWCGARLVAVDVTDPGLVSIPLVLLNHVSQFYDVFPLFVLLTRFKGMLLKSLDKLFCNQINSEQCVRNWKQPISGADLHISIRELCDSIHSRCLQRHAIQLAELVLLQAHNQRWHCGSGNRFN